MKLVEDYIDKKVQVRKSISIYDNITFPAYSYIHIKSIEVNSYSIKKGMLIIVTKDKSDEKYHINMKHVREYRKWLKKHFKITKQ